MLTSDMCLGYRDNVKLFKCLKYNDSDGGWANNMRDCFMTFKHDGFDLDPHEVNKDGPSCAWTKWVYIQGFGLKEKELCGVKDWGSMRKKHNLTDLKR